MIHGPSKIEVPGSKSITNRALLCAALAKGKSCLRGALSSDDTKYMARALQALGIKIKKNGTVLSVFGGHLKKPKTKLFCGNAGTAVRFLTAVLASQPFESIIDGDKRMRERPIKDLVDALCRLGANIASLRKNGCFPLKVFGPLRGGKCRIKSRTSSQFLSGLLLASPLASKKVEILVDSELVSKPYADMTIAVMKSFGVKVSRNGYKKFVISAGQQYKPRIFEIEGDASSASYFLGLGELTGENIQIKNISEKSLQADMQFAKILNDKKLLNSRRINCVDFPDAAMTLAAISPFIKGKRVLYGLSNLRVKECDRLHALTVELKKIGARVRELPDGLEIIGTPEKLHGATINTYNDHRMAMCFGMIGAVIPGIKINNQNCVKKTYLTFWKDLAKIKKILGSRNIILTGMRGTGKSKIGRALAKKLNRRFIDLDAEIEISARRKIGEIVRTKGWAYFRKLEGAIVRKFRNVKGAVIATGGGTMMKKSNSKILKRNGKVIFLDASPNILQKRLKSAKNRPSLTKSKNFLDELAHVYKKREKRYFEVADFILDVSKNTRKPQFDLETKVNTIRKQVARWGIM